MRIHHASPGRALGEHVERFWWCETEGGPLPRLFPGTGAELWVHYRGAVEVPGVGELPPAHLVCLRRTRWSPIALGPAGFLVTRFRAGALHDLVPAPVGELTDQVIDTGLLWGTIGRRLSDAVRLAPSPTERIRSMSYVLSTLLGRHTTDERHIGAIVRLAYGGAFGQRVDRFAMATGYSSRQLQRMFPAVTGATPKEFLRLTRFQRLARAITSQSPYAEAAFEAGYYDQNHMIREFRRFTGMVPTAARGMAHSYYPPLPAARQAECHEHSDRNIAGKGGPGG